MVRSKFEPTEERRSVAGTTARDSTDPLGTSTVLIVDDDAHVADSIKRAMNTAGYQGFTASTAEEGLVVLQQYRPNVVVLDLCLPGMSGDEFLTELQNRGSRARVLVLTGINNPARKVALLRGGADDYMTKPFDIHELLARTDALLQRGPTRQTLLLVGPIALDPVTCEARSGGRSQHLSPSQSQLLALLLERFPFGVPAREIISKVHPYGHDMTHAACKVLLSNLRKSLKTLMDPPPKIAWRRGEGWAIAFPPTASA